MSRLAVLSAGPLGRVRGMGRALPKARGLGVFSLPLAGEDVPAETEAEAGRLAALLRNGLGSSGDATFAALCAPSALSDEGLSILGTALERQGISLGLAVSRFALADRLARGEGGLPCEVRLLDGFQEGVALFDGRSTPHVAGGALDDVFAKRRTAALRAFQQAGIELNTTHQSLDAWLEATQRELRKDPSRDATWYYPDGTQVDLSGAALAASLDEVQVDWAGEVLRACVEQCSEGVDALVVAGWLDALFHVGTILREALPDVRVFVLEEEGEVEILHKWFDHREPPQAGQVWLVESDLALAPATLSWPATGGVSRKPQPAPAPSGPRTTKPAVEQPSESKSAPTKPAPKPAKAKPRLQAPQRSLTPLYALVAILVLGQVATLAWIFGKGGGVEAGNGLARNGFAVTDEPLEPSQELVAELEDLRDELLEEKRTRTAYRFRIDELESALTKLRYGLDSKVTAADLGELRTELETMRLAADAELDGNAASTLAQTVAQLALDVQDLMESEAALAKLSSEVRALREGGVVSESSPSPSASDLGRIGDVESALSGMRSSIDELELRAMGTDQRLELMGATLEGLDLDDVLETLTATSHTLMERVSKNERALANRPTGTIVADDLSDSAGALLIGRCDAIEQTLRTLRSELDELGQIVQSTEAAPTSASAEEIVGLVDRIRENEETIANVRQMLETSLPRELNGDLAPSSLYTDLSARRFRVFNAAGDRVARAGFDPEGHGAFRLYAADGSRQVLLGSAQGGEAGFIGTFNRKGDELFMVTTQAENGAGHLSLMDGNSERKISMTTDSDGDGVLWIRDRNGKTVEVLGGGGDLAEMVRPADGVELFPGQVVRVVGADVDGPLVAPTESEYDTAVLGIISAAGTLRPAVTLNSTGAEGERAVALAGHVFCLADATDEPIRPGDLLTSSARAGHARRADPDCAPRGSIIGKALDSLDEGTGLVRVWVLGR